MPDSLPLPAPAFSATATPPTPLALYIHWPFCLSKCPYCDFNSHVREKVEQERWRKALLRELEYYAERTASSNKGGRRVTSIFFGGGTPSLMPPETVAALIDAVKHYWPVADNLEITLEANPTSVEAERLALFRDTGINRVSLGVQALRDEALRFLGRQHGAAEALKAVELAATLFHRMSFDLIYARPQQTLSEWRQELREALPYAKGHLSLYQLTIEPGTHFFYAYQRGEFTLPEETEAAALYEITQEETERAGLPAYEISNHAATGEASRHNCHYWQGKDYLGIGPGAHGRYASDFPADRPATRLTTENLLSPEKWLETIEREGIALARAEALDARSFAEDCVLMGLRLTEGIAEEDFQRITGYPFREILNPRKWEVFQREGLLTPSPTRLQATPKGRLLTNQLTGELLGG